MNVFDLIDLIEVSEKCKVFPAKKNSIPTLRQGLAYPNDLLDFYSRCNGLVLFDPGKDNISFEVLPLDYIVQSNLLIVGEECEDDLSSTWYTICKTDNGDYISIDLSNERNGRCYDSNYEVHGVAGSCPIIALSFTELLNELYKTNGVDVFWSTKNYGDAYS